jgi:predicted transcriptional regulator of viral defense system
MDKITDRYQKLLEAQATHQPTMTIREMGAVLNIRSTSYIRLILDRLVAEGRAVKIRRGLKHVYRIVESE